MWLGFYKIEERSRQKQTKLNKNLDELDLKKKRPKTEKNEVITEKL